MATESTTQPTGYLCWDPKVVGRVINPEAAAPSIDVLLATHQSVPLERVGLPEAGRFQSLETVSEDDVLEALTEETGEALIVPIIGPSGSGKSHFVLWLNAQLRRREEPWRRIVYVPKGDLYLANVIDLILMDEKGPEFDRLRKAVRDATVGLDVETAALKLRNAVAVAVGKLPAAGDEAREAVVDGLPALLSDADYAPYLLAKGCAFSKAAAAALGQTDEEVEARFDAGDLPIVPAAVQQNLGQKARDFLRLLGSQRVKAVTYEILNEVRDSAMSEVFGIKPNQLVRVMRQLREELFKRDPKTEIVLMIEDFTLLQGVQYELLEAMLALPVEGGKKVMCELKAVIAVTSGRFTEIVAKNDTLRTRLESQGHIYEIDLAVGPEGGALSAEHLMSFVGRYLNVVRAGPDAAEGPADVRNVCAACPYQDGCHPVFGADDEAHGLYPFDREFIANLMIAQRDKVNPRQLLNTLRRGLTEEADALRSSRFPSPAFLAHLEPDDPALREELLLSPSAQNRIIELDSSDADRRIGIQTWWTSEKDHVAPLDGILEVFGLSQIEISKAPPPPPPAGRKGKPGPTPRPPDPFSLWVSGGELPAPVAREVRKHLRNAVLEILGGASLLITENELNRVFTADSISIEGSAGGGHRGGSVHEETFSRDARNGVLFACLDAASAGTLGTKDPREVVTYTADLHRRAETVRAAIEARKAEWADEVNGAVRSAAMFAVGAGLSEAVDLEALLRGVVDEGDDARDPAAEWFPKLAVGTQAHQGFRAAQERLLGFATGAKSLAQGGPISYDVATLLPPLEELSSGWTLSEDDLAGISKGLSRQLSGLGRALDEAHTFLEEWLEQTTALVGGPRDVESLASRLHEIHARAVQVGVASDSFVLSAEVRDFLPGLIEAVDDLLSAWDTRSVGERIVGVVRIPRSRLDQARDECQAAGRALDAALVAAEKRADLKPGQDLAEMTGNVKRSLSQLRAAAESAREHAA